MLYITVYFQLNVGEIHRNSKFSTLILYLYMPKLCVVSSRHSCTGSTVVGTINIDVIRSVQKKQVT